METIEVNFKQSRKGKRTDILVIKDSSIQFELHYPADGYTTPYGIALLDEDKIRSLNKDRKAKYLYNKYKVNIEDFTNNISL